MNETKDKLARAEARVKELERTSATQSTFHGVPEGSHRSDRGMKRFNSMDTHATTEHPGSESDDEEPIMIQRRVPASLERQQNIATGFTKDTSAKDVTEKQGYLHKQGGHVKVCYLLSWIILDCWIEFPQPILSFIF